MAQPAFEFGALARTQFAKPRFPFLARGSAAAPASRQAFSTSSGTEKGSSEMPSFSLAPFSSSAPSASPWAFAVPAWSARRSRSWSCRRSATACWISARA